MKTQKNQLISVQLPVTLSLCSQLVFVICSMHRPIWLCVYIATDIGVRSPLAAKILMMPPGYAAAAANDDDDDDSDKFLTTMVIIVIIILLLLYCYYYGIGA